MAETEKKENKKEFKTFTVTGSFIDIKETKKFSKEIKAINERNAEEKIMSIFGSKHGAKRRKITITEVKEGGKEK